MNDDTKFWITVWSLVAVVAIALIAALAADSIYTTSRDAALIEKGADPIRIRCMRASRAVFDPICLALFKESK